MTNQNNIELLISSYLEGKATESEKEELRKWIQKSPDNARHFRKEKNIWQGLHPAFDPNRIDTNNAESKLMQKINRRNPAKTILQYWQRTAAILIIPLIFFTAYLYLKEEYLYQETEYQEIAAPYGMHSEVNLPDGSKVWLNGGSSLKYPVNFKRGKRNVTLDGEGYFEVQANQKNPFVVTTPQITLTATGTAFNIEAYAMDSVTSVTMVKGKVDVGINNSLPHAKGKKTAITMKPGERASLNNHTLQYNIVRTDPYKWYAWKDGLMIFRDDPLSYVFKRLELTFNVNIDLKDKELASSLYRATFEVESLDEILRLLEMSAPLRFVYQERVKSANNYYEKQHIEVHKRNTPLNISRSRTPSKK